MKRFLLFISALLVLESASSNDGGAGLPTNSPSATLSEYEYNLLLKIRGKEITELCFMSIDSCNNIVGTVINEMGIKAFDFTHKKGKTKVLNVMGPLNKWYIRRLLKKDFSFILTNFLESKTITQRKRKIVHGTNGEISVSNERFKIYYLFTPMKSEQ